MNKYCFLFARGNKLEERSKVRGSMLGVEGGQKKGKREEGKGNVPGGAGILGLVYIYIYTYIYIYMYIYVIDAALSSCASF